VLHVLIYLYIFLHLFLYILFNYKFMIISIFIFIYLLYLYLKNLPMGRGRGRRKNSRQTVMSPTVHSTKKNPIGEEGGGGCLGFLVYLFCVCSVRCVIALQLQYDQSQQCLSHIINVKISEGSFFHAQWSISSWRNN
jgi:hypothetical protein